MIKKTILVSVVLSFGFNFFAQEIPKTANWYNKGGSGMYTDKATKKVKKMKSETVIVAVIDNGVDIEHEDLTGKIWTNSNEIPGNGIDDDGNVVNTKNAHISFSEKQLTDASYPTRNADGDVALYGHKATWIDSTGSSITYTIREFFPDETIGVILCILGDLE